MKNEIRIKVYESDDKFSVKIETDIMLTNSQKFQILNSLFESMHIDVDFSDAREAAGFAVAMVLARRNEV